MKKLYKLPFLLLILSLFLSDGISAQVKDDLRIEARSEYRTPQALFAPKIAFENLYPLSLLYSYDYSSISTSFFAAFYWDGKAYATRWNPQAEGNSLGKIYRFSIEDNTLIPDGDFVVPDVTGFYNFEGFCTDGEFIYAVNESQKIFIINSKMWTIEGYIPHLTNGDGCIAYDPVNDGFWVCPLFASAATFYSRDGEEGITLEGAENGVRGLAFDIHSDGGPYLWTAFGGGYTTSLAGLGRWNVTTGEYEDNVYDIAADFTLPSEEANHSMGSIYTYEADGNLNIMGIAQGAQTLFGYQMVPLKDFCDDISNPKAEVNETDIILSWDAPLEGTPTGYEISRDRVVLQTVTTTSYTDENIENGIYRYAVKALYDDCETLPAHISNVMKGDFCEVSITMYDLPDDGWDGDARINVYQDDNIVGVAKLAMGLSGTSKILMLPYGSLDFVWVAAKDDEEVSFTISFYEDEVYTSSGKPTPGTFFTHICGDYYASVTDLKITKDNEDCDHTISWDAAENVLSYNIYRNDNLIHNTTQESYTINMTDAVKWCVEAVYEDGTSVKKCIENSLCNPAVTDITLHTADDIIIIPNPANSIVNITGETTKVKIYDYTGRRIYAGEGRINTIDVSGYLKGMYFIKIFDINGKTTVRQLIVK